MGLFDDLVPAEATARPAIPPVGRALLDTIAGSESPGYDVMYGGGKFQDFADHPRRAVPIAGGPNAGRTSSAAGRYQFLGSTWDEVKKEAGLPDFSPESQDQGAWHLANKTYKTKTGRDLATDLESSKNNPNAVQAIGRQLSGVWTSLPGGIEPNRATMSFANRYDGAIRPPTEMSSQAKRPAPTGLFDDLVPANAPQPASPPATDALPADAGGRFTDEPGQNFRTAREGQSPTAEPPKAFVDKLTELWENPPKDKLSLVGMIRQAYDAVKGVGEVAGGQVPVTDENGNISLDVIKRAANLAMVAPLSSPGGIAAGGIAREAASAAPAAAAHIAPAMAPALEANIAARNIGVDLPRAIGTDSALTKFMGQVANKMPGGGPMREGVETAVRQTGDAVSAAAERAGGAADAMAAGQGFQGGVKEYFKPTIKKAVSEAYDKIDEFVDAGATRPLAATARIVDDIVSRRAASGEADPGKAVKTVLGGVEREEGLTYAGVKDLRTRIGEMLDDGMFPEGMSQTELRRIYSGLSDDLRDTIAATGGEKGVAAWKRANAVNTFVEEWKGNLGKLLGTDKSGEAVTAAILRTASEGSTGDLKALTMARAAVPKEAWRDVAATAISGLGKDRKGDFSPAIFLNDFAKLSDRGKTILFKDVGSGDVLPHLNDIAAVAKKFVEAGKLANTSGTAGHGAAMTMMGGTAAGFLSGSLMEPVTAISVVIGNNLMARALSKPASAAAVARWSRAYEALAKKPDARSLAVFNMASRNLANTLNSQVGARAGAADFLKAIQGGTQKAAAESDQQQ